MFCCKGIHVRISGEGDKLMHHKFCLIDGTSAKGVLITGSLNWTYGVSTHDDFYQQSYQIQNSTDVIYKKKCLK